MEKEARREREVNKLRAIDERKRPYNSLKGDTNMVPTEEEMEAYRLRRRRHEDPMANF